VREIWSGCIDGVDHEARRSMVRAEMGNGNGSKVNRRRDPGDAYPGASTAGERSAVPASVLRAGTRQDESGAAQARTDPPVCRLPKE
jgi:hypothetical protein